MTRDSHSPGGLLKHLRGEGNAHECLIMRVARLAAQDHVYNEFAQHLRRVHLEKKPSKR
jgi:hypothetical protein